MFDMLYIIIFAKFIILFLYFMVIWFNLILFSEIYFSILNFKITDLLYKELKS